jgi:hypothetical protein
MDPTQWPLDIDVAKTAKAAQENPLYPGGPFTVYGEFCWAGDKQRAEAYFIPAGTRPSAQTSTRDPEVAKKAMQQLQAEHMLGASMATGDGYATFLVPDDDKVLDGTGDNTVARLVVYDNRAHRASAVDEKTVLTLKATKKPISWPLIAGVSGLLVVIVLLALVLLRGGGGGGGGRRRGAPAGGGTPAPPAFGVPPAGGYGGPPAGGGYGMQAIGPDAFGTTAAVPGGVAAAAPNALFAVGSPLAGLATPAPSPPVYAPAPAYSPGAPVARDTGAMAAASPPILQVRCPSCGMSTMATAGQPSVCFSCGQPLPSELTKGGGQLATPAFPSTGAMPPQATTPAPFASYGVAPGGVASAATIRSAAGQFTIRSGAEVRVGRDPAQCPIFLGEPRVSGVHATLKVEAGQLVVRDESSNNGTWVSGARIAPGVWTAVPVGLPLRFGPIEFAVQLEA